MRRNYGVFRRPFISLAGALHFRNFPATQHDSNSPRDLGNSVYVEMKSSFNGYVVRMIRIIVKQVL